MHVKRKLKCIFCCFFIALFSFKAMCSTEGTSTASVVGTEMFLTADLIQEKITDILSSENGFERENKSFQFKKYITSARYSSNKEEQEEAIKMLKRQSINNDLKLIIERDLKESYDFLYRRMMHAEAYYQLLADNTSFSETKFDDFVGRIEMNGYSFSGTLIPLPVGEEIVWHVLTCAHFLNGISAIENGPIQPVFHPSSGVFGLNLNIKSIKIFKKKEKSVRLTNITNSEEFPFEENTINFPDIRATPRFDGAGDVALCELDLEPVQKFFLDYSLNIQSSTWDKSTLKVKRIFSEEAGREQNIFFHFTNNDSSAKAVFESIKKAPKFNKYALGYMGLNPGAYSLQISHTRDGKINSCFEPAKFGDYINQFNFTHDIPMYWGMSGGPIIQVHDKNNINVFGVVRSSLPFNGGIPASEKASLCSGSFLIRELIS
ncbi:MAG: hypothetical protein Q8S21_06245 [Candidatus Paracaedibacteraceae bacterium]|nr:hypothetical protein [Candidatus Paracaedibacteraceae bacterium]